MRPGLDFFEIQVYLGLDSHRALMIGFNLESKFD